MEAFFEGVARVYGGFGVGFIRRVLKSLAKGSFSIQTVAYCRVSGLRRSSRLFRALNRIPNMVRPKS